MPATSPVRVPVRPIAFLTTPALSRELISPGRRGLLVATMSDHDEKRFARHYVLLHPDDCEPPHGLDLEPGSRDSIKVERLTEAFARDGFDKTMPALVGYPLDGRVQLASGTHRHEAAKRAGIRLPVKLTLRSHVEAMWGTPAWEMTKPRGKRKVAPSIARTEHALADLRAIDDYLADDDPLAAGRLVGRLIAKAETAARLPMAGRVVPEEGYHAGYGFVPFFVLEGESNARPQPTTMFLWLDVVEAARK